MTDKQEKSTAQPDPEAVLQQMNEVAQQSQRALQAFWERQTQEASSGGFSLMDSSSISNAFADWSLKADAGSGKAGRISVQNTGRSR